MKMLTELDWLRHRVKKLEEFLETHFGVVCNSLEPIEEYYIKLDKVKKENN